MLNDKTYKILKWVGLIALPALAVFVQTVGPEWGFNYVNEVVVTLNGLGTLIGALIGLSTMAYNDTQNGKQ
jgi:hypothetical protein